MFGRQEKTFMKFVVNSETDKVLGASMSGPDALEIMQENEEQLNIFDYTQNFTTDQVNLKSNCPIPPIACNWYKFKDDIASGWESPYNARIDVFKKMISTDIATQEIINLSSP
ncbi:uncharacterized protein Fot_49206 [Forsythia ovata]|uniref:Pyridine nucleotide-disulphide oxidoreductase dimerisation domain-containing protein n=2 Tax=Forsythia ovata TaxID=205694 RepID=A0ABD1QBB2_9LAMI